MITIMPPTYNRAYILNKAYMSLKNQTSFDFEWIIIDDGSTDNTEQIVSRWKEECKDFEIVYFKQQNGGKHRAVNKAIKIARNDWFLILDSDDQLTENAVETVHSWIAGVAGLKGTAKQAIGGKPKQNYIEATNLERKKYGLLGDKVEVYKTKILKQYPFPEFDGENFIRESAVWDHIAKDGLKLRWHNEIIYLCEYIEDGLTKNTNEETYKKNFEGFTYCSRLFLKTHSGLLFLHKCGEFYHVAKLKNISYKKSSEILNVNTIVFGIGVVLYKMKKWVKSALGIIRGF